MKAIPNVITRLAISIVTASAFLASAAYAQTLKVGYIGPLTGAGAAWGIAGAEGARAAVDDLNAKGGLKVGADTYKVELISYDDRYAAADALSAYTRLVYQDGVKFIVILTGTATVALKKNIESDKVLALTSSYTEKAFDPETTRMFRLYSTPHMYMGPVVAWIKKNVDGRKVVILNPNDEVGWDHEGVASKGFTDAGFEVLRSERYERNTKDFQPLLTKVIAMKPDIIDLAAGAPATSGIIVRQARELGYKGRFVKTGGSGLREILDAAGAENAEGTINVLWADASNEGFRRVAAAYKARQGQEPNELIAPVYDGVSIMLQAIGKAGTVTDTAKVAESFGKVFPYKTLQGDEIKLEGVNINGIHREVNSVSFIGAIKNGQIAVVGRVQ